MGDIKVELGNFCAAMDTLIHQDVLHLPIYMSQITVLRYGVALVNGCGVKQWYIMY